MKTDITDHAAPAAALDNTRRRLLKSAGLMLVVTQAGLVFAADKEVAPAKPAGENIGPAKPPEKFGGDGMPGGIVYDPLAFVSIDAAGIVTVVCHRSEMGQGVRTSIPMVVADELDADWSQVRVRQAQGDEKRYGNQNTDGSRSLRHALEPLRQVGCAARTMLINAAAEKWGVPAGEVTAKNHELVHSASGRKIGFGDVAVAAAKLQVPARESLKLKDQADFRYIGKTDIKLLDGLDIAQGRAGYGIDTRLDGMVYAVVARPPVLGGKVKSFNDSKALKVPGVLKVIELKSTPLPAQMNPLGGVAVVAKNTWAALKGREALTIEWEGSEHADYDSAAFRKTMEAAANKSWKPKRDDGDAMATLASAKRKVARDYYLPHIAHAAMEPLVATVRIADGKCEVWAPTQAPQTARENVAKHLGMQLEDVMVNVTMLGGGFGRKSKSDFISEAALVSKAMDGKAVKLQWTREDDTRHDYFHAVAFEHMEAALDENGKPTAWLHRSAAPTITSTFVKGAQGLTDFEIGMTAINVPFQIPNLRVEAPEVPAHTRIGWFRSVYNVPHAFAVQSFVNELATEAKRDHKDYLLELIGPARKINPRTEFKDVWNHGEDPEKYLIDTGRMRRVLELVAAKAGWGKKLPKGQGLGLAVAYSFMSYTATAIEVAVDDNGDVKVVAVNTAIDCGPHVNPERIRSQMEGAAVMGLSLAMHSEITFKNGKVDQSNFNDYVVMRTNEVPREIHVHLTPSDFSVPPGGVGEPGVPPVAPALTNAIFAATGKRIRELPIGDQLKAV